MGLKGCRNWNWTQLALGERQDTLWTRSSIYLRNPVKYKSTVLLLIHIFVWTTTYKSKHSLWPLICLSHVICIPFSLIRSHLVDKTDKTQLGVLGCVTLQATEHRSFLPARFPSLCHFDDTFLMLLSPHHPQTYISAWSHPSAHIWEQLGFVLNPSVTSSLFLTCRGQLPVTLYKRQH